MKNQIVTGVQRLRKRESDPAVEGKRRVSGDHRVRGRRKRFGSEAQDKELFDGTPRVVRIGQGTGGRMATSGGPDAWPDLVHQHFADVYKALEVEIKAEKRELENPSNEALKHGGHAFWQWGGRIRRIFGG